MFKWCSYVRVDEFLHVKSYWILFILKKSIIKYMKLVESLFKIFIYLIQYVIKKEEVLLNTWSSFEPEYLPINIKNYWLPNLLFLSVASCNRATISWVYHNIYKYKYKYIYIYIYITIYIMTEVLAQALINAMIK